MKIIETWDEIKQLAENLPVNKKINRFLFQGVLHDGHHYIINQIKKDCDILIAQCNEVFLFISYLVRGATYYKRRSYYDIVFSVEHNNNIDYLVLYKLPPEKVLDKITKRILKDLPKLLEEAKKLKLSTKIVIESLFIYVPDPITPLITDRIGPKSIVQLLLHKKTFPNTYSESFSDLINLAVMEFYKNKDGSVMTRGGGVSNISFIRELIYKELLNGETKRDKFQLIMNKGLIVERRSSILDLNTVELLDEINDNCVLVMSSFSASEFIFIKDGRIIY